MTQDDRRSGDLRALAGAVGGMFAALWAGGSTDPVDAEELPRRYSTATLVAGTLVAAALVGVVGWLRTVLGAMTGSGVVLSPFWLLVALVMFLPVTLAFAARPPHRVTGLVAGVLIGLVAAVALGWGLLTAGVPTEWGVLAGLAVGALTLALVFGLTTRERTVSAAG